MAALASRLDASAWRVRIDDIDPPREVPGSAERIVAGLVAHGFPGAERGPERQSANAPRHRAALRELCADGHLFACTCTRRELGGAAGCVGACRRSTLPPDALEALLDAGAASAGGTASTAVPAPAALRPAVRARLGGTLSVRDRVLGEHRCDLDRLAPDVVVLRRDGWFAYHLATAVDDAHGIDDVVRGADLFESTGVQLALMRRLGRPAPRYAHVPVALGADGAKLSKGAGAAALDPARAAHALHAAWRFLGQRPLDAASGRSGPDEGPRRFWELAPSRWRVADVPPLRARRWAWPSARTSPG